MSERIMRVKSLKINKFRGFIGPELVLDTDAEIVLLTGPNGVGKTSLVDALCLSVTGHYYRDRTPLLPYGKQTGSISTRVLLSSGKETEIQTTVDLRGRNEDVTWNGPAVTGRAGAEALAPLRARAAFYFQDTLKYLFEEESGETYLEDFITASQVSLTDIRKALKRAEQQLKTFQESFTPDSSIKTERDITEERTELARRFDGLVRSALEEASVFPTQIEAPATARGSS